MILASILALLLAPAPAPAAPVEADVEAPAAEGPLALDTELPCGLRVIAVRDMTLPVAAVVLAIETGTEDDPADLPGLVHALAYQVLEGNRELAPHGAARLVHDGGGVAQLAIGAAQIRYESLVPISLLDDVLWVESQRLRTPTISEATWKDALRMARRDRGHAPALPRAAAAALHMAPGLGHDGHPVSDALTKLGVRAIAAHLGERFTYDRATLIVVAPEPPDLILPRVSARFADLPDVERKARDRTATARTDAAPRELAVAGGAGQLAWAIGGDVAATLWAEAVCATINRIKHVAEEPTRARLRCAIDDDARRGAMILRPSGTDDPLGLVRGRLSRIVGADRTIFDSERRRVAADLAQRVRTPLGMARWLARGEPAGRGRDAAPMRPQAELVGDAVLLDDLATIPPALAGLLEVGAALKVNPAR